MEEANEIIAFDRLIMILFEKDRKQDRSVIVTHNYDIAQQSSIYDVYSCFLTP